MSERRLQGNQEKRENSYYVFDTEKNILGEGGMGVVYLGKKVAANGTETKVAIKEIKIKDHEIIERARREASIQLNNDNLIRMYGMIETTEHSVLGEKSYYVISEFLEGVMLDDLIEGRLKNRAGEIYPYIQELYNNYTSQRAETATYIVKCILSGVMALHDAGYIHRDIDPTNIMVTADGKIKLIDFGIAKQMSQMQKSKSELTTPGQFIGKAEYAAPELILGDTRHQNSFTDTYAIGILYYQLVTGRTPFGGTKYDVIESQLHKKVPLGNIKSWQIRDIIRKATEKKQADRYTSSALFRAAIDGIVYPEPRRTDRRIIGAAIAVVAVLAIVFAIWGGGKGESSKSSEEAIRRVAYDYNNTLLDMAEPDSIMKGFDGMKQLANGGHSDAMYQLARIYLPFDDGYQFSHIKQVLHLNEKMRNASLDQKTEALRWLRQTVESTDSAHYEALFRLAFFYYDEDGCGVVQSSYKHFKYLVAKSMEEARKNNDNDFLQRAQSTIKKIDEN